MENDFSGVKVGDKVFHVRYGWGSVSAVPKTDNSYFEIEYSDTFRFSIIGFTITGNTNKSDLNPSVFWDEVIITPPPKPKRKVEKIIKGWLNIYPGLNKDIIGSACYLYQSQENADKEADKNRRLGKALYVIHNYTVEE